MNILSPQWWISSSLSQSCCRLALVCILHNLELKSIIGTMIFSVTNSKCLAQYWLTNRSIVSPTLNVDPTLFVIPCKMFGGIIDLQCCKNCHSPKWIFSPNFNLWWQYFITSCWQEKVESLGQRMNSSITHDNTCSLIHN